MTLPRTAADVLSDPARLPHAATDEELGAKLWQRTAELTSIRPDPH